MKKLIITSASVLVFCINAFADKKANKDTNELINLQNEYINDSVALADTMQPLYFKVTGDFDRCIKQEKLADCTSLSDIIEYYPFNWITTYDSVEILTTCNSKQVRTIGKDEKLSKEQMLSLKQCDIGTEVFINVWYKFINTFNDDVPENHQMHVKMMIVPEKDAEYIEGYEQLITYLKLNVKDKLIRTDSKKFSGCYILFKINEQGKIKDAHISKSTGDAATDKLLLDVINKMPTWKPAENSKGKKVKQQFVFSVEQGMGGC